MDSRSSSPDPLGQPDLSSPLDLKTPTRSGSRRKTRTPHNSELEREPVSGLNLATPSPEPPSFEVYLQTPASEKRQLLSPWRPEAAVRAAQEEEMEQDVGHRRMEDSPDEQYPNDVITTTVPLKTGEETPKRRRKKRRPLTPKRRRSTPVAKQVREVSEGQPQQEQPEVNIEAPLSPTPRKRGPGRPRIHPTEAENFSNERASNLRFQPVETAAAPGASPGKRRRVVSGGDTENSARLFEQPLRNEVTTNRVTSRASGRTSFPSTNSRQSPNKLFAAPPSTKFSRMARSQDPTEEHDEFDSIVESEDFTMVSLSSIPSGQQLRSLTRGDPTSTTEAAPAPNSPRRSPRSPRNRNRIPAAAPASPQAAAQAPTQTQERASKPRPTSPLETNLEARAPSTQVPDTPYGNGLLSGFSPATRRELRAGLRLGQELARRSVQARKAAAEVEDATGDVFAELAATESSNLSTSSTSSRMDRRAPASEQLLRPLGGPTVDRPKQLPSPEQSDEQEPVIDHASEMSWKYDTPGRNRLGVLQARRSQQLQATPPKRHANEASDPDEAQVHSSPDKQLFLEQAAAEIESSRFRPNSEVAVELSSNEPDSDDSSDEEPPELSEATRSLLADATGDIWQSEAESSKISRSSRVERPEPEQEVSESNGADNSISQDSEMAFVAEESQGEEENDNIEDDVKSESDDPEVDGARDRREFEPQNERIIEGRHIPLEIDEMMQAEKEEIEVEGEEDGEDEDEEGGNEEEEDDDDEDKKNEEEEEHLEGDDEEEEEEELEVDDEADTVNYRGRQIDRQRSGAEAPESPLHSSPPLRQAAKEPSGTQEKSIFDGELLPPRRGKLLSLWRRQSDEPIVYSDEPELPPAEDTTVLGKRQRTFVTPESRKKGRYDDADFSVLSEFKGPSTRAAPQVEREPVSSPLKRVRFESEDPENPYLPTTPVLPSVPQIYEDPEEEEEEEDESREMESEEDYSYEEEPIHIKWDKKPATPPRQGSWLSGWLPSWFKAPKEPIFSFSLPNLPQLRKTAPHPDPEPQQPDAYQPRPPPPEFSHAHYAELKRLYHAAKERPFPAPRGRSAHRISRLLGWEICRMGWRKRVNRWELGIIAEFLRPDNPLAAGVSPEHVARRLFSIWAVEVQRGNTGLGRATPGLFSTRFVADRDQILARARRKKSMAAS